MKQAPTIKGKILEMIGWSAAIGAGFLIINYAHFQFLIVNVVLYACIVDMCLSLLLVGCAYHFLWGGRSQLLNTEKALVGIASTFLILLYAVMGPTVIDRSLSLYIVQKVDDRGGRVAEAAFEDIFIQEYMPEFRLVDVRLTEQLTSGTLTIENGCAEITPKGRALSRFVEFYRHTFLPKRRNLMGEVTDQLTDPFFGAEQKVDVSCPN